MTPQAIMNGVIVKRIPPTHYNDGSLVIPEVFRDSKFKNQWVECVSVGPRCKEDQIKPGDKILIGINTGTNFEHEGVKYTLIYDRDPLAVNRG